MTVNTTKLPLANSNFIDLRSQNKIYIDKTRMIYELAKSDAPFFLSRPRRFGKSLLVSTFKSLFSRGLEDFKGLEIEKLWKEEKTYPVIHLDCSGMEKGSFEEFEKVFNERLALALNEAGMEFQQIPGFQLSLMGQFAQWLIGCENQGKKLVLLVDEYDAPLTAHLNNPTLFEKVRDYLRTFYAYIKSYKGAFRFVFVTGIAKFQKASIFSEMNAFTDITLNPEFGPLLGYTQTELEKYFGLYLDNAAKALKITKRGLLKRLEEEYDGFCFDEEAKCRLYAPWSVLKFLTYPGGGFKNYWIDSGGVPTILEEYFKGHEFLKPEEFLGEHKVTLESLSSIYSYDQIQPIPLLTQTGYLTIDSVQNGVVTLRYPNEEVFKAMGELYTKYIFSHDKNSVVKARELGLIAEKGEVKELIARINQIFLKVPYPHGTTDVFSTEASVLSHLLILLAGGNWDARGEIPNGLGRTDVIATFNDYTYVFELKLLRDKDQEPDKTVDELLEDAAGQIKTHRYGEEIITKHLIRLAMVFSEKKRQFIKWQQVD